MIARALAGLLVLGVALGGTIVLELTAIVGEEGAMIASTPGPPPIRLSPAAAAQIARPNTRDDRQQLVDAILSRPLFVASRRPAATLAAPAAPPANLPRLAGIMVDGGRRRVIFAPAEGGRPVVAQEGAQIGAYTVQSIEAGQVTLSGPSGAQVLRPTFDPQPRDSIASPTAGVAPFAAANDVLQSLRGLPGFSGAAR